MRFACCITKATNTHIVRICNTFCFSMTKTVTRTLLNVTLPAYCLVNVFVDTTAVIPAIYCQSTCAVWASDIICCPIKMGFLATCHLPGVLSLQMSGAIQMFWRKTPFPFEMLPFVKYSEMTFFSLMVNSKPRTPFRNPIARVSHIRRRHRAAIW